MVQVDIETKGFHIYKHERAPGCESKGSNFMNTPHEEEWMVQVGSGTKDSATTDAMAGHRSEVQ